MSTSHYLATQLEPLDPKKRFFLFFYCIVLVYLNWVSQHYNKYNLGTSTLMSFHAVLRKMYFKVVCFPHKVMYMYNSLCETSITL